MTRTGRRAFLVRLGRAGAALALTGPATRLTAAGLSLDAPPREAPARDGGDPIDVHMRSDPSGSRVWFEPAGILVRPGDVVRWTAVEGVHTATAYHPENGRPLRLPPGAEPWDSGYLVAGRGDASFEIRLVVPGVYDFFCRPHEAFGMVGRIVVWEGTGEPPDEPGYAFEGPAGTLPQAARGAFPAVRAVVGPAARRRRLSS